MTLQVPLISTSVEAAVTASETDFGTAMTLQNVDASIYYEMVSNTACWIKQGAALKLTVATKANTAAGDYFTLTLDGVAVVYQLNVSGTDAAIVGATQIDISGATTAAQVAALVRTAVLAAQPGLTSITDNGDGTLDVLAVGKTLVITENVAHASFTVTASAVLAATAGTGSKFCAAGERVIIDPKSGQYLSIIRDAADGKATLTRIRLCR